MLELALFYGQGAIFLKDIAKRQKISEKYLGHLIPLLKAAGLIFSSRGARGGYSLAKPPQEITLAEIIEATEGSLLLADCLRRPRACHQYESCVTRDIWERVGKRMKEELQSITLSEVAKQHKQKQNLKRLVYNI